MRQVRSLAAFAALLPLALTPAAPQQGRFAEQATVLLVEVPVQVLDHGQPVRGLTADDFEIRAAGKRVEIVGFEVIDLADTAPGIGDATGRPPALSTSARRHFLLLFDLSFSEPGAVVRAHRAAWDLVLRGLHPSDLVAVATYAGSRGVDIVLGFTSDRNQLAHALSTLGLAEPYHEFADPLGIVIGELDSDLASRRASGGAFGSADDPRDPAQQRVGGLTQGLRSESLDINASFLANARDLEPMGERVVRDQQEGRIASLSGSLAELAALLAGVQGRTHVVFLSEGFDSAVILGNEGTRIEEQARSAEIAESAARGEFWRVDNDARFGSGAARGALFRTLGEFKRAGAVIQAVDIGGVRAGGDFDPGSQGQNGLFIMANETGGELYRNYNELADAMADLLRRTSVTYVLAFEPRKPRFDGSYQRLDVKLKRSPKGVRLVHRPGYYEPRPYREVPVEQRRMMTASLVQGATEGGALDLSVLAAPVRFGEEKAYVPVFLEVDGESLLAGTGGSVLPLEIYAYAFDRGGAVRDFFSQAVAVDLTSSMALLRLSGYKFWGHLDLGPGDYLVRGLVRNASTGATGVRSFPLRVPVAPLDGPELLPPFFAEPDGRWVLGQERETETRRRPYPYLAGEQPVLPAARPWLWPGRAEELRLLGYGLGEGPLELEARLLDGEGEEIPGVTITLDGRQESGVAGLDHLITRFEPGDAPPGPCTVEITVRRADGAADRQSISCRVRGRV